MNRERSQDGPDWHSLSDLYNTFARHGAPDWHEKNNLPGLPHPDIRWIPRYDDNVSLYVQHRRLSVGDRPIPEEIRRRLRNARLDVLLAKLDAAVSQ